MILRKGSPGQVRDNAGKGLLLSCYYLRCGGESKVSETVVAMASL